MNIPARGGGIRAGAEVTSSEATHDGIRLQLVRIVGSAPFSGSLRLTRFLTFVVKATLAGEGARIKAYTIAIEALGRGSEFDPQADPIVRVEAGRLRAALARYYADAGRDDPVVIELPRGSYVPTFRRLAARSARLGDTGRHRSTASSRPDEPLVRSGRPASRTRAAARSGAAAIRPVTCGNAHHRRRSARVPRAVAPTKRSGRRSRSGAAHRTAK